MERAPELIELADSYTRALVTGDMQAFADMSSTHESFLVIGTDELEWWDNRNDFLKLVAVQLTEMGIESVETGTTVAWKDGTFGWVATDLTMMLAHGVEVRMRMTLIFRREGPYWRVVHAHSSNGVPNADVIGFDITTSLDSLLSMAHDDDTTLALSTADGNVVVMFTDIEGSTVLLEALGEDRWMQLHRWHDDLVQQQVAMFGGTIVKNQGDGFMIAFTAPGAAIAAAQGIQRALRNGFDGIRVPVRIGIHAGNAREEAGDFFGKTVVVAARVAASAGGGDIRVTDDVYRSLGGVFPAEGPIEVALKGISAPCNVYQINW